MSPSARRCQAIAIALAFLALILPAPAASRPNFIIILADDLGYGDLQCLNPRGRIPTPNFDRVAAAGMTFTDAHSSSAVCTPTRYGLLTGRYNWRSRLQSGVLGGMSPPLIEPDRVTLPRFLQQHGYHTACLGKWHLGFDWPLMPGAVGFTDTIEKGADAWRVDFKQPIRRGPTAFGFDEFFGIAGSLDMVPYVFIANDRVTAVPTIDRAFPMMIGRTNAQTRRGPGIAGFEAEEVLPILTRRATDYIDARAARQPRQPFFLYLALNSPHTPIVPSAEWRGRSGLNPYADFVMQTDATVGAVLDALDRNRLANDTVLVVASDNGCSPEARFQELRSQGHDPNAGFRGSKADIFEGGHRIPLLIRWPQHVRPGSRTSQLACLNDLFATFADILGTSPPRQAAEDSVSLLPVLKGRPDRRPVRRTLVHHSINGSFAIREGPWKLEVCPDSGGWSSPQPGSPAARQLPLLQLYHLGLDPAESTNVAGSHPDIVARLQRALEKQIAEGRSTPGPRQTNTVPVRLRRE